MVGKISLIAEACVFRMSFSWSLNVAVFASRFTLNESNSLSEMISSPLRRLPEIQPRLDWGLTVVWWLYTGWTRVLLQSGFHVM